MAPSVTMVPNGGSAPNAERPKLITGLCMECEEDHIVLDGVLARHFDLRVCLSCKQDRNLRFGWYELISKSKAKAEYALPDSYFHGLPFVAKANPRHESFAPLKLYLKKTIIEGAKYIHGDEEAMEKEKATRKRKSYERAASRTKHLLKRRTTDTDAGASSSNGQEDAAQHTSLEAAGKDKKPVYVPVADRDHQHQFASEHYDDAAKSWVKSCECGMRVHFEKW